MKSRPGLEIKQLIASEQARQESTLMMIPSENYASSAVREALGSVLSNKYSEGYPGARYYQGNNIIDQIERRAIESAKQLFKVPYANVQPYSGSPANSAIYFALLQPGDTIMGLKLSAGGHLTHAHPDITFSGKYYRSIQYDVDENGFIDMEAARQLALKEKPRMITVGTTAYPRTFDWKAWREIADSVRALLLADISHIAGLIVGGAHPSPAPYVDIIMTTTHKTLRGPRGAMILVTETGLAKNPEMGSKIDRAVFPGLQGGPHDNTTAAIAIALEEASQPAFTEYAQKVVENARSLATELMSHDLKIVTNGTDNHLMIIDLRPFGLSGNVVAEALEVAGIITNRNSVPHDTEPPFYPSGIRLGTPALTTRGMGGAEMKKIAAWIATTIQEVTSYKLPEEKEKRRPFMQEFKNAISTNENLLNISREIEELCTRFPTT